MPDWHPVHDVMPVEFYYPQPGTKDPFAIIRWVDVMLEGEPVSRWRCVTFIEPRQLIDRGYYSELADAARACHRAALSAAVPAVYNKTGASR